MELEGPRGTFGIGECSRMCSHYFSSFRRFRAGSGQKKADFGPKLQILKWRSSICDARSKPPPLNFSSYFVWLSLTPIGSIHQHLGPIPSTRREL